MNITLLLRTAQLLRPRDYAGHGQFAGKVLLLHLIYGNRRFAFGVDNGSYEIHRNKQKNNRADIYFLTTFFFPVFLTEAALLFIITEINHFSVLRKKACPQFLPFIISNPFSFLKSIIKIF